MFGFWSIGHGVQVAVFLHWSAGERESSIIETTHTHTTQLMRARIRSLCLQGSKLRRWPLPRPSRVCRGRDQKNLRILLLLSAPCNCFDFWNFRNLSTASAAPPLIFTPLPLTASFPPFLPGRCHFLTGGFYPSVPPPFFLSGRPHPAPMFLLRRESPPL